VKINPPAPPTTSHTGTPKAPAAAAAVAAGIDATERTKETAKVRALPKPAAGGEFDAVRVSAIREEIRAGRYQINPEGIADGLLASVRDLIDSKPKS
jgi:negative regulator of flagellin synthesis FlgM